jgi:hypothetical protein
VTAIAPASSRTANRPITITSAGFLRLRKWKRDFGASLKSRQSTVHPPRPVFQMRNGTLRRRATGQKRASLREGEGRTPTVPNRVHCGMTDGCTGTQSSSSRKALAPGSRLITIRHNNSTLSRKGSFAGRAATRVHFPDNPVYLAICSVCWQPTFLNVTVIVSLDDPLYVSTNVTCSYSSKPTPENAPV